MVASKDSVAWWQGKVVCFFFFRIVFELVADGGKPILYKKVLVKMRIGSNMIKFHHFQCRENIAL